MRGHIEQQLTRQGYKTLSRRKLAYRDFVITYVHTDGQTVEIHWYRGQLKDWFASGGEGRFGLGSRFGHLLLDWLPLLPLAPKTKSDRSKTR